MVLTSHFALEIKEKVCVYGGSTEDAMMPKTKEEQKRRLKRHEGRRGAEEESRKIGGGGKAQWGKDTHPNLCYFNF